MANSGPNTNGSQFFLTFVKCEWLNGKHTVFGTVVEGIKVLDAIEATGSNSGKPSKPCKIIDCGEVKEVAKPKQKTLEPVVEPKKTKLDLAMEAKQQKEKM